MNEQRCFQATGLARRNVELKKTDKLKESIERFHPGRRTAKDGDIREINFGKEAEASAPTSNPAPSASHKADSKKFVIDGGRPFWMVLVGWIFWLIVIAGIITITLFFTNTINSNSANTIDLFEQRIDDYKMQGFRVKHRFVAQQGQSGAVAIEQQYMSWVLLADKAMTLQVYANGKLAATHEMKANQIIDGGYLDQNLGDRIILKFTAKENKTRIAWLVRYSW